MPSRTNRERWPAVENRAAAEDRHRSFCKRATPRFSLLPGECCAQILKHPMDLSRLRAYLDPRLPKSLRTRSFLLRRGPARSTRERPSIQPCQRRRVPIARLLLSARENCDCCPRTPKSPELSATLI